MHNPQRASASHCSGPWQGGGLAVVVLAFVLTPMSFAQSASDPDLSGTWLDQSNANEKITLIEKGDKIQVHETDGGRVIADYTCNLSGAECKVKENGRTVSVTIYYNGPKLVEIKQRGSEAEKRRFWLGEDGKTMSVEIIPLSGEGKTTTHTYQKQDSQMAKTTSDGWI